MGRGWLVVAPSAGCDNVTAGDAVSTVNVEAKLVPVLPAASCCSATAVYWPSGSAAPACTDQLAPLRDAVSVCSGDPDADGPAYTRTATTAPSPGAAPAAPENAGRESFVAVPAAGCDRVTPGAAVSTENVEGELVPVLPALSLCSARAVYTPSASAAPACTDHAPPLGVAESVCAGEPDAVEPAYTRTVTVGASPSSVPAVPLKVGRAAATLLPFTGTPSVTAGAVVSGTTVSIVNVE